MFREKYILDNEMIKPDEQLLTSLKIQMKTYTKTHDYISETATDEVITNKTSINLKSLLKYSSYVACFLILIISIKFLGIFNESKNNSKMANETTSEDVVTESQDAAIEEYSITENSLAASDSSERKADEPEIEAKVSMEIPPSSSITDGKIEISGDTVTSIFINKTIDGQTSQQTLTDSIIISDLVNCINSLLLSPISEVPSVDTTKENIIKIQYNNGAKEDIIYLNETFIKMNESEWYELKEADFDQLISFIK